MKRTIIAIAVGSVLAAPAFANVTVYGKINATLEMESKIQDTGDAEDSWQVKSNSSRFGVGAEHELIEGLSAFGQLEWEVDVADKGDSKDNHIKSRNQFVGLKGGFGSVLVGRHDTPLKLAQGKVDQFNDLYGDLKTIMPGEDRASNTLLYATPKFGEAVTVRAAILPGEEYETTTNDEPRDGVADGISLSVDYDANGLFVSLAHNSEVKSKVENTLFGKVEDLMDITRLTATYGMGDFSFGALYQQAEIVDDADNTEATSYLLSGAYKIGNGAVKAQYGTTNAEDDTGMDADVDSWSIGYDHNLSKSAKLFAFYTNYSYDAEGTDLDDESSLGVGIDYKF